MDKIKELAQKVGCAFDRHRCPAVERKVKKRHLERLLHITESHLVTSVLAAALVFVFFEAASKKLSSCCKPFGVLAQFLLTGLVIVIGFNHEYMLMVARTSKWSTLIFLTLLAAEILYLSWNFGSYLARCFNASAQPCCPKRQDLCNYLDDNTVAIKTRRSCARYSVLEDNKIKVEEDLAVQHFKTNRIGPNVEDRNVDNAIEQETKGDAVIQGVKSTGGTTSPLRFYSEGTSSNAAEEIKLNPINVKRTPLPTQQHSPAVIERKTEDNNGVLDSEFRDKSSVVPSDQPVTDSDEENNQI